METNTTTGITGSGPAGLMLPHPLSIAGIAPAATGHRTRAETGNTARCRLPRTRQRAAAHRYRHPRAGCTATASRTRNPACAPAAGITASTPRTWPGAQPGCTRRPMYSPTRPTHARDVGDVRFGVNDTQGCRCHQQPPRHHLHRCRRCQSPGAPRLPGLGPTGPGQSAGSRSPKALRRHLRDHNDHHRPRGHRPANLGLYGSCMP